MSEDGKDRERLILFVLGVVFMVVGLYQQIQGDYAQSAMFIAWACYLKVCEKK